MLAALRRRRHAVRTLALLTAVTLGACRDASTATDSTVSLARRPGTTSSIVVTVDGLPTGTPANIQVTGGGGYAQTVTGSTTLGGLANGSYTFTASGVTANGVVHAPTPLTQTVGVSKGSTGRATITYAVAPTTGALSLTVSVPNGAPAAVTVTGPGGFSQTVTASTSIPTLAPGSYIIAAASVTSSSIVYAPTPASQTVAVTAGATTSAAVTYAPGGIVPGTDLNLQIVGMSLVQSVQKLDNSVPLVTGRNGVLRVYAVANGANSALPAMRVRLFQNGALVSTLSAAASGAGVPASLNEGSAAASWNVSVPGALMQPGLSVLADVDPDNVVAESNDGDNSFPITGQPLPMTIRNVRPFNLRFVPVTQSVTGATGAISAASAPTLLTDTRDILPIGTVNVDIRTAYTTSAVMQSGGAGWEVVLNELQALRASDGASNTYYGVLQMNYTSGVVGMGYIGAPIAIGSDYPSYASSTLAHELGHNFGRYHAPCGGVSGADTNFPYAGGQIGVFGFNVRTGTVIPSSTADLMGYCNPSWISDYNYTAMMNYRGYTTTAAATIGADVAGATVRGASPTEGLLVWGRVDASGIITLEPATRITAPTQLPAQGGDYTLTASDETGRTVYSASFTPVAVAEDAPNAGAHFAFVIPMSATAHDQLARLTVSGRGRSAERRSAQSEASRVAAAGSPDITSESSERARVKWNAAEFPMVVVRDADSGEILSFARGGNAAVATRKANLELTYSDGVRSAKARVRVRGR